MMISDTARCPPHAANPEPVRLCRGNYLIASPHGLSSKTSLSRGRAKGYGFDGYNRFQGSLLTGKPPFATSRDENLVNGTTGEHRSRKLTEVVHKIIRARAKRRPRATQNDPFNR